MAVDLISKISSDESERARYLTQIIADMNYNDDISSAKKQGVEEGKVEVALNLIENGCTDDFISKTTKLGLDVIQKLKAESAQAQTAPAAES
jgi:hypothetical protein